MMSIRKDNKHGQTHLRTKVGWGEAQRRTSETISRDAKRKTDQHRRKFDQGHGEQMFSLINFLLSLPVARSLPSDIYSFRILSRSNETTFLLLVL